MFRRQLLLVIPIVLVSLSLFAQTEQYGPPITADTAKKVAAAAIAEARKNNWTMAIAIVDPNGTLVYFEKMDNTQNGSVNVAQDKARAAALFKRPTKSFQDTLAAGGDGLRILSLQGAVPVDGGIPIIVAGKIIGAVGASGGTSAQDGQVAKAGADAVRTL
jgi:glc operon protein GlcG